MIDNLPTIDGDSLIVVLYSEALRQASNQEGVQFESDDQTGDTLYITIKDDPISDLICISEVKRNDEHMFCLQINSTKTNVGDTFESLESAIETGKQWAGDKHFVQLMELLRPSVKEVVANIADRILGKKTKDEGQKPN